MVDRRLPCSGNDMDTPSFEDNDPASFREGSRSVCGACAQSLEVEQHDVLSLHANQAILYQARGTRENVSGWMPRREAMTFSGHMSLHPSATPPVSALSMTFVAGLGADFAGTTPRAPNDMILRRPCGR